MSPFPDANPPDFVRVLTLDDLPSPGDRRGWPWTESSPPLTSAPNSTHAWPPIGIVTPSFNQGRYLEATIRSVLLQGYPALEYYIEDGGSTDESVEIIRKYEALLSGWVSEKDRGQSHAINKAMARLRSAHWVNWLNSDDILLPGALGAIGRWAAADPQAVAVIGRWDRFIERWNRVVENGRPEGIDRFTLRNWRRHHFLQPACFFSKAAFDRCGRLNESLHYAMDIELWVKLGEIGEFALIDDKIARDREHPAMKTIAEQGNAEAEACQLLFERGYREPARQMIVDIVREMAYLHRLTRPVTENGLYRRWLRPWVRRMFAPEHLKPKVSEEKKED